jgi:hypothetical protein
MADPAAVMFVVPATPLFQDARAVSYFVRDACRPPYILESPMKLKPEAQSTCADSGRVFLVATAAVDGQAAMPTVVFPDADGLVATWCCRRSVYDPVDMWASLPTPDAFIVMYTGPAAGLAGQKSKLCLVKS